jgi:two-component system sensor histidine kinase YesM
VRQEIEHLEHYLYIIGILYEESVQYEFDVDESALGVPCLKAVLQPIVENSVKHGLESPNAVISIRVSVRRWGDRSIRIVCADDGPGFPESKLAMLQDALVRDVPRGSQLQEMKRIGLLNVHYRLSMYDSSPETGLSVRNLPTGGAEVAIVLPNLA